jgi:serine/threonine protein kinase
MIGSRLRHYRITASLGRGGMGEVWLARDITLGREVAIKTLPASTAPDADIRKERFFREARAASALNHPNIVTIYEINADHDVDFIAMEYVAGRTLAELLQDGPLPLDRARRIAQQIADALGRAHSAGIVHRDLKPRNIMITGKGLVKVLDFGVAKVLSGAGAGTAATQMALTRVGTTVGTLGYMSPEQAIGDAVDARSDVFSFGVILYEMLTGRLPFSGKTLSDVLQQLHFAEPPPLESLRADVPASLRNVVVKALRKKPDDRYTSMNDVTLALASESVSLSPNDSSTVPTKILTVAPTIASHVPARGSRVALIAVVLVMLAMVAIVATRLSRTQVADIAVQPPPPVAPLAAAPSPAEQPAPKSADADSSPDRATTVVASPAAKQEGQRVDSGNTSHVHWGKLGDAYRTEPGQQVHAGTAYRRAIDLIDQEIANAGGGAGLESWRALYLAKLGDRAAAVAAVEPLIKQADLTPDTMLRIAIVYELAGARQRALMSVARAVRAGVPSADVVGEPELAALRSDPRFQRVASAAPARKRPVRR